MRGSIQKKGNTYYAVIATNGKRKWLKGGLKKETQVILLKELNDGTYKEIPKATFSVFSDITLAL